MLRELSLFTGLAGFTLGLKLAGIPVRTVCYVEIDPYRQQIIRARIRDGLLDDAPIWDDIRAFDGRPWRGAADILTIGFPCQPHSVAGKRLGAADPRDLWPDTARVLREVGPRWALLENPPGLLYARRGGEPYAPRVLGDLAQAGYDAVWDCVSAAEIGAPHLRLRWWCLAWHTDGGGREGEAPGALLEAGQAAHPQRGRPPADPHGKPVREERRRQSGQGREGTPQPGDDGAPGTLAHADSLRCHRGLGLPEAPGPPGLLPAEGDGPWWSAEPGVGRVAHGVPHRVDRIRALGDSLVPAVVAEFLRRVRWTGSALTSGPGPDAPHR